MSSTLDSKVVELKFDNKEFEANARQSINTLQELKRAIDENVNGEAFKNLENAANNVDLSGISSGIDMLTDRFSVLGTVGEQVIKNVTDLIMNKLGSSISFITNAIEEGGKRRAQNIQNARFQLSGLLNDEEKVELIMQNASEAVHNTAFGMDEAAKAASMFAASGVQAGDEMLQALRGIGGVAATTNSSFEDISRIFTTIAGNGRMMGDQLLQLGSRGLNVTAMLANYFNDVVNNEVKATKETEELIKSLMGVSDALEASGEEQYRETQKALNNEYNLKKKVYDKEYKALQKLLNNEYNIKKNEYDKQYKALSDALNAEIAAVQKSNSKRIDELNEAYQADVEAYRKATNEKISLINEEYTESIKLIDEERYNRIKAIDDQIKGIQDLQEAEEKERELAAENEQRKYLQQQIDSAKFKYTRQKAEEALAEFEKQVAEKRLKEQRQNKINELNEEKNKINDEAALKKQEAAEKRSSAIDAVQEESNAKLQAMAKAHQAEMEAIREQQQAQVDAMREANSERLSNLKAQQTDELEVLKEGQNAQLEAKREANSSALNDLRESQNDQLLALKTYLVESGKLGKSFGDGLKVTEEDLKQMVSSGLISFDLFAEAMATTFGDHATEADNTFQGVMSNVRAALARTGQMFYEPFLVDKSPIVYFLKAVKQKINEINTVIKPFANTVTSFIISLFPSLTKVVEGFSVGISEVNGELVTSERVTKIVSRVTEMAVNIISGFVNILKALYSVAKTAFGVFRSMFDIKFDNFEKGSKSIKDFMDGLAKTIRESENVKSVFSGIFSVFKLLGFAVKSLLNVFSPLTKLFGNLKDSTPGLSDNLGDLITNFVNWLTTSEKVQEVLETLTKYIDIFVNKVVSMKNVVKEAFSKAFSGFDAGKYFTDGFLKGLSDFIPAVIAKVMDFGKEILNAICKVLGIHSPSTEAYNIAMNLLQGFINGVKFMTSNTLSAIRGVFHAVIDTIKETFEKVDISGFIENTLSKVEEFTTNLSQSITNGIPTVTTAINNMFGSIASFIDNDRTAEDGGENFVWSFIKGIKNALWSIITTVVEGAKTVYEVISKKIQEYCNAHLITTAGELIHSFAQEAINKTLEFTGPIGDAITAMFGNLTPEGLLAAASGFTIIFGMIKILDKFGKMALNPISTLTSTLKTLGKTLKTYTKELKAETFLKIAEAASLMILSIAGLAIVMQFVNPAAMLAAILTVAGVMVGMAFLFDKIMDLKDTADKSVKAMDSITSSARDIVKAETIQAIIESIVKAMGSIVLAIAGLVALYKMFPNETEQAVAVMVGLTVVISIIIAIFAGLSSKMGQASKNFMNAGLGFVGLAGALYLIILSIQKVTTLKINLKDVEENLWLIIGILGTLLIVMGVLVAINNKLQKNEGSMSGELILSFCGLLLVTIFALKKLMDMGAGITKNIEQLALIGGIMFLLVAVLAGITFFTKKAENENFPKLAGTILGICAFLLVTIAAIALLSIMKLSTIAKGLVGVIGIMVALAAVLWAVGKVNTNDGWKSILAMAAVVGALTVALAVLSMLKWDALLPGAIALAGTLLAFGFALRSAKDIDIKAIGPILSVILGIAVIGALFYVLQDIPWEQLLTMAGSISAVILAMGACLKLSGDAKLESALPIISMGIALGIIGFVFYALKNISWESLLSTATAISGVLLAMAECVTVMNDSKFEMSDIGSYVAGIASVLVVGLLLRFLSDGVKWEEILSLASTISEVLLAMAACVTVINQSEFDMSDIGSYISGLISVFVIGVILRLLSDNVDWQSILPLAASISLVLVAMGVCLGIVGAVSALGADALNSAAIIVEGVLAIAAIATTLAIASNEANPDAIIPLAIGISILLLAVGAACLISAGVGTLAEPAIVGIGIIDLFIANLAGILYALGELAQDPSIVNIINDGGALLESMGLALGRFVGSIVGGALERISDSFPHLGQKLSEFMLYAQPFFLGLRMIDDKMVDAAKALAAIVLAISTAELISGISDLFSCFIGSGDMAAFGKKLASFGESAVEFYNHIKGIDNTEKLKDVAEAMNHITKMASGIPNSGGWLGKVMGENDVDEFGKKLVTFSQSLITIATNFATVPESYLKKFPLIADAISSMSQVASSLPNSGGWLGKILGDNDIDSFGYKLLSFSTIIGKIAQNFKEVPTASLDKFPEISEAMKSIAGAAKDLPNSGGWLGKALGENDINDFGNKLVTFSAALKTISANVGTENVTVGLNKLIDAMPKIKELADSAKTNLGFKSYQQIFAEQFMLDVEGFVRHLNAIVNASMNLPITPFIIIKSTIPYLTSIEAFFADVLGKYPVFNNLKSFLNDLQDYTRIILNVALIALNIRFDALRNLITSFEMIKKIKSFFEQLGKYKSGNVTEFSVDLRNYTAALKDASTLGVEGLLAGLQIVIASTGLMKEISIIFEKNFRKYKSGALSAFLSDFNYYLKTVMAAMAYGQDISAGILLTYKACALILKEIKDIFVNLRDYKFGTIKAFLRDFTDYTNTISKVKGDIVAIVSVLNSLTNSTSHFISIIPLLSTFNANNFVKFLNDLKAYGAKGVKDLLNAFNSSKDTVVKAVSVMFSYIVSEILSKKSLMENSGKLIPKYIALGVLMRDALSQLERAISEMVDVAFKEANKSYETLKVAGHNAVIGFARGIYDQINDGTVESASKALGEAVKRGLGEALDMHSPSKETEKMGSYTGEGFVNGLLKWIKAASSTGAEVGESALDSIKSAISKVSEEIQNDDDFMPVITPVLDLSNVEANASKIGGMLNLDKTIQLSSSAGLSFAGGLSNLLNNIQASIPDNTNDDVVDAINGLRSDMNVMNERINNLQVVMDSGELVGAIINPIDEQLGFNATLVERGVR